MLATVVGVDSRAGSLHREEDGHENARGQEKGATTGPFNTEGSAEGPCQVPDLKDTVDEELHGRIFDTDGLQNTLEVVRNETVSGPLGEEGERNDDPETLEVTCLGEEGFPANIGSDGSVEIDGSLDLVEFVPDKRIV